jgi:hypothetical protein
MVVQPLARRAYAPDAAAPSLPHCRADNLSAQAFHGTAGNGMGHRGVEVWLINRSDQDCTVQGRPRVLPDDGTPAVRTCAACETAGDTALVVPAGAVLVATGRSVAGIGNESACGTEEPVHARAVSVFLPDDPIPVSGPFGGNLYCHGLLQMNGFDPL